VAYQTAYLKAHYPAEYMAALLTCNLSKSERVAFYMDECHRMGIQILSPDVNESHIRFTPNKAGNIRFGLGAIKGVGSVAAEQIIAERKANGAYKDVYDFVERFSGNRRTLDALVGSGVFDDLGVERASFFVAPATSTELPFVEQLLRYGIAAQESKNSSQHSLFGAGSDVGTLQKPKPPVAADVSTLAMLNRERELVGIYISSHPLDEFKVVFDQIVTCKMSELDNLEKLFGKSLVCGGLITKASEHMAKNGNPYGRMTIEDFGGSHEFSLFGNDYVSYKNYFVQGCAVLVRASVQERWQREGSTRKEFEVKISKMRLMREFVENDIRKITLNLNIHAISNELIGTLTERLATLPKGSAKFRIKVVNEREGVSVDLISHKYSTLKYCKELEQLFVENGMEYSIV
jgi:DNA polymerase-3 subunit alpha